MEKLTKLQKFEALIDRMAKVNETAKTAVFTVEDFELVAHEVELLQKEKATRKPSKVQKANVELKDKVAQVLAEVAPSADKAKTVTELLATGKFEVGTSNQKLSAMLKQLVEVDKRAVKVADKKTSRFYAVEVEIAETEAVEE